MDQHHEGSLLVEVYEQSLPRVSQRLVHVKHAIVVSRVRDVAATVDMEVAACRPQLRLNVLATLELGHLHADVGRHVERQVLAGQEVREGDQGAVLGAAPTAIPQVVLVEPEQVLPHVMVGIHGPPARAVEGELRVRARIRPVELRAVPREQRRHAHRIRDSCGAHIDTQLVACRQDRLELRDGVGEVVQGYAQLVGANGVEDAAELGLQGRQPGDDRGHLDGQVPRDDEHVLPEAGGVDLLQPRPLALPVVQMHVRDGKDPRGGRRSACICPTPRTSCLDAHGAAQGHLLEAGVAGRPGNVGAVLHLQGLGEDRVGLLVVPQAEECDAQTAVQLHRIGFRLEGPLRVAGGGRPVPELCENCRAVGQQVGTQAIQRVLLRVQAGKGGREGGHSSGPLLLLPGRTGPLLCFSSGSLARPHVLPHEGVQQGDAAC
mmetsp:Transcript_74848/g.236528  ORF Transcript_74848/g.236528 Transcript_74848/m.236528 type:complete len:433 (-) Transcript_74848:62-1360(-)